MSLGVLFSLLDIALKFTPEIVKIVEKPEVIKLIEGVLGHGCHLSSDNLLQILSRICELSKDARFLSEAANESFEKLAKLSKDSDPVPDLHPVSEVHSPADQPGDAHPLDQ